MKGEKRQINVNYIKEYKFDSSTGKCRDFFKKFLSK